MTFVSVYLDGNFAYARLLEPGESIPRDGFGITYVALPVTTKDAA